LHYKYERLEDAIPHFKRAIKDAGAKYIKGESLIYLFRIAFLKDDFVAMELRYRQVMRLYPDNPDVNYWFAIYYFQKENYNEAEKYIRKYLKHHDMVVTDNLHIYTNQPHLLDNAFMMLYKICRV